MMIDVQMSWSSRFGSAIVSGLLVTWHSKESQRGLKIEHGVSLPQEARDGGVDSSGQSLTEQWVAEV